MIEYSGKEEGEEGRRGGGRGMTKREGERESESAAGRYEDEEREASNWRRMRTRESEREKREGEGLWKRKRGIATSHSCPKGERCGDMGVEHLGGSTTWYVPPHSPTLFPVPCLRGMNENVPLLPTYSL